MPLNADAFIAIALPMLVFTGLAVTLALLRYGSGVKVCFRAEAMTSGPFEKLLDEAKRAFNQRKFEEAVKLFH